MKRQQSNIQGIQNLNHQQILLTVHGVFNGPMNLGQIRSWRFQLIPCILELMWPALPAEQPSLRERERDFIRYTVYVYKFTTHADSCHCFRQVVVDESRIERNVRNRYMLDRKTFPQNPVQYSKGTFMHCRLFFNITSCGRNGNALTDVSTTSRSTYRWTNKYFWIGVLSG